MKIFLISIMASLVFSSCSSQNKFDLEKMSFTENVKDILKDKKKFAQERDVLTTLPSFYTYQVQDFKYGNVNFVNNEADKNNNGNTSVYFLCKDTIKPYKIKGFIIDTDNKVEGDNLTTYLKKANGEPKKFNSTTKSETTGKPNSSDGYIWKNVKENFSILLIHSYVVINDKDVLNTKVVVIDSDILDKDPDSKRTVLERIKQTYTN
jgi:hypothetical protein